MIKEIFLPEKTNGRRLISRRIIGMTIRENSVSAAQIYATSSSTQVERIVEAPIPPGAPNRYNERASHVIKTLLQSVARYDQIRISIPSTIATFKELTLPFLDPDKIRMVIEYEVEAKLPFSINEAIIDFVITKKNTEEKTSQVLVAAVRKQDLQNIFDMYTLADIDPDTITVDLFALYGFYLQIPEYKNLPHATSIIDIGATNTSVAFLVDGQMRLVRTISKGLQTIAQHVAEDTGTPLAQTVLDLSSFGLEKPDDVAYTQAIAKHISTFLNDIQFTLNSFSLKLNFYQEISKILFVGLGDTIKGFNEFASTMLQISCEPFSSKKLFKAKNFKNKSKQFIDSETKYTLALATAISYPPHDHFNLRKKEFTKTSSPLMNKQIMMSVLLTIVIFLVIGVRGFFQINDLRATLKHKEKQAVVQLKKIFPPGHKSLKKSRLKALFRDASREVRDRQEAWQPFFQENLQPLEILKDLTQTMDKRSFNIKVQKISIVLDKMGAPVIDVDGQFASQPGRHFADFGNFTTFFEQHSKTLAFSEQPDLRFLEGGTGVEFTFMLKVKKSLDED